MRAVAELDVATWPPAVFLETATSCRSSRKAKGWTPGAAIAVAGADHPRRRGPSLPIDAHYFKVFGTVDRHAGVGTLERAPSMLAAVRSNRGVRSQQRISRVRREAAIDCVTLAARAAISARRPITTPAHSRYARFDAVVEMTRRRHPNGPLRVYQGQANRWAHHAARRSMAAKPITALRSRCRVCAQRLESRPS